LPKPRNQILDSPLRSPLGKPATATQGAVSGLSGHLVYHVRDTGGAKSRVEVSNADGSAVRVLSQSAGDDVDPAWSPDGKQVAFGSDREGHFDIYVIPTEGGAAQRLTSNPAMDWGPSWSRDGKQILFASNRDGPMRLYVMNADGSDQRRLMEDPEGDRKGDDWSPVWSPKRDEVAFVSDRGGKSDIYLLDLASKQIKQLTQNDFLDDRPSWSPNGEQLVYMGNKDNTVIFDPDEIWVIGRTGGAPRQLTDNLDGDIMPTWSPDGKWIAFSSSRDGGWRLYVVPAAGGDAQRISQGPAGQRAPRWGP
jgi:TolB protein